VTEEKSPVDDAKAGQAHVPRRGELSQSATLLLLSPVVVLLAVFFIAPLFGLLIRSVTEPHLTLHHYERLFSEPLYLSVIFATFRTALLTTALTLLLGYPIAILMSKLRGWKSIVVAVCVFIPLWTSVLVRTYGWIILLRRNGLINGLLQYLGITNTPLALLYNEGAVLLAMSQVLLPFMIIPIYSALSNVSKDYEKAARSLGANWLSAFFTVTLPLSMPGIFAGSILVFVLSLGFYITPVLIGGAQTLTVATLIGQQATQTLDWPFASALSVALLVFSLATAAILKKLLRVEKFGNI
jgi:mannopine transport system permease protein